MREPREASVSVLAPGNLLSYIQLLQLEDYILADMETRTDDTDSSWQATQLISESKQKRCN